MTITLGGIIYVCTAISIIAGAATVIFKVVRPIKRWKDEIDEKLERDYESIVRNNVQTAAMINALIAILGHLETNNNTGAMRAAREQLTKSLIFGEDANGK
jgi:energy-converting hydrogenase Eha subunit H